MSPNASTKEAKASAHPAKPGETSTQGDGKDPRAKSPPPAGAAEAADTEAPAGAEGAEAGKDAYSEEVEALTHKLTQSEMRLSATLAQYKDALDEFADAKARIRRDVGKEIDAGKRSILSNLLEVVDNLERAIEAAKSAGEADDAFFEGVCMVRDQFLQKLESMGVTRRKAAGEPFDPDHFEAISTVPVPTAAQNGVVVGVVRDCYMLGNETLRHGMVAVGKHVDG